MTGSLIGRTGAPRSDRAMPGASQARSFGAVILDSRRHRKPPARGIRPDTGLPVRPQLLIPANRRDQGFFSTYSPDSGMACHARTAPAGPGEGSAPEGLPG